MKRITAQWFGLATLVATPASLMLLPELAFAQSATSPFLTGATAPQSHFLALHTPIAIILIMVLGGMAMANRMEVFLVTKSLVTLLVAIPVLGICALLHALAMHDSLISFFYSYLPARWLFE